MCDFDQAAASLNNSVKALRTLAHTGLNRVVFPCALKWASSLFYTPARTHASMFYRAIVLKLKWILYQHHSSPLPVRRISERLGETVITLFKMERAIPVACSSCACMLTLPSSRTAFQLCLSPVTRLFRHWMFASRKHSSTMHGGTIENSELLFR